MTKHDSFIRITLLLLSASSAAEKATAPQFLLRRHLSPIGISDLTVTCPALAPRCLVTQLLDGEAQAQEPIAPSDFEGLLKPLKDLRDPPAASSRQTPSPLLEWNVTGEGILLKGSVSGLKPKKSHPTLKALLTLETQLMRRLNVKATAP